MTVKDLKHTMIPPTDNLGFAKAQMTTKFLFGQRVVITTGFFKGTKGWIMDFSQNTDEKTIGVPPYTQIMQSVTIVYSVRLQPLKNSFIDVPIPETNLKKALY